MLWKKIMGSESWEVREVMEVQEGHIRLFCREDIYTYWRWHGDRKNKMERKKWRDLEKKTEKQLWKTEKSLQFSKNCRKDKNYFDIKQSLRSLENKAEDSDTVRWEGRQPGQLRFYSGALGNHWASLCVPWEKSLCCSRVTLRANPAPAPKHHPQYQWPEGAVIVLNCFTDSLLLW